MKNYIQLYSLSLVLLLLVHSCDFNYKMGNGNIIEHEIKLDDFARISIGGNYRVTLIESNETRVVIECDENLLEYINAEHYENTLNINNVHNLKSTEGIVVDIYYKALEKIYSTGASKVTNEGVLKAGNLMINLSGAGAIDLKIDTKKVEVNLTGAGVVSLSGKTDKQETHISGAGGLEAKELLSNECSINLSGLGGAQVYAVEKLEATITGVGGIIYSGNPKIIERQVTGFGKIKRAEEYIFEEDGTP